MRYRFGAVAAALLLSACGAADPDEAADAVAIQDASPVPGGEIASLLSGRTVYARYDIDSATLHAGDPWVEYYRPDGRYYYEDQRRSFAGRWSARDGKLCFSEKTATVCGDVYNVGSTVYFTQDGPGASHGTLVGSSTRIEQGDVEGLAGRAGGS
ncbi:MAG: hypothetical protein ACRC67_09795 [Inquilinus sp.]|uniref:hypothetical protein n=1 Tax=Inquilinus sp. TaxID=1932117 RepID=UPI003F2B3F24